nr:54s ribosomal protein l6, mitochondrial [Quercus suber]
MSTSHQCCRSVRALQSVFTRPTRCEVTVPTFLAPAFAATSQTACFSTTLRCNSKIGAAPLSLPPDVTFTVTEPEPIQARRNGVSSSQIGSIVRVEGPLGKMSYTVPPYVSITANKEARTHTLSILDIEDKKQRAMWGTARAYLQNHILGVSEGHTAILRLVGVGYRATIEDKAITKQPEYVGQKFVSLKVGYSHPIELGLPIGVKASTPQPTRILLEGCEKEVVMEFAAKIRAWRKPEPYKGKGIFVNDETIKLKAKKIK